LTVSNLDRLESAYLWFKVFYTALPRVTSWLANIKNLLLLGLRPWRQGELLSLYFDSIIILKGFGLSDFALLSLLLHLLIKTGRLGCLFVPFDVLCRGLHQTDSLAWLLQVGYRFWAFHDSDVQSVRVTFQLDLLVVLCIEKLTLEFSLRDNLLPVVLRQAALLLE